MTEAVATTGEEAKGDKHHENEQDNNEDDPSKKESDSREAYLIRVFQYERCQNKKPGGEGPKREAPPHFTYVVTTSRPNEGRRISSAGA